MALEYLAALNALWEFLGPILGDTLKERFILTSSEERAKKGAFRLYRNLERVHFDTNEFVISLDEYTTGVKENNEPQALLHIRMKLLGNIVDLTENLTELRYILENMNLPMKIHLPGVLHQCNKYRYMRGGVMNSIERIAKKDMMTNNDINELSDLLATAKMNQTIINTAIDNFRNFLKEEFSFKESF